MWVGVRTTSPWAPALCAGAPLPHSFMPCCDHGIEPHINGAGPHPHSSTTQPASQLVSRSRWGQPPPSARPAAHGCSWWSRHASRGPGIAVLGTAAAALDAHGVTVTHTQTWVQREGQEQGMWSTAAAPNTQPGHEHVCGVRGDTQPSEKGVWGSFLPITLLLDPLCSLSLKRVSTMAATPAPNGLSLQPKPITFAHSLPISHEEPSVTAAPSLSLCRP